MPDREYRMVVRFNDRSWRGARTELWPVSEQNALERLNEIRNGSDTVDEAHLERREVGPWERVDVLKLDTELSP